MHAHACSIMGCGRKEAKQKTASHNSDNYASFAAKNRFCACTFGSHSVWSEGRKDLRINPYVGRGREEVKVNEGRKEGRHSGTEEGSMARGKEISS